MSLIGLVNTSTGKGVEGVASNDSRLTDARTPTAHASSHSTGQSDAITAANIGAEAAGTVSNHNSLGTSAHGGIVASNDSRLTDARTPLAHDHILMYAAVSQVPDISVNEALGQITMGSITACKVVLHQAAGWNTTKTEYTLTALTSYQLTANTYSYVYANYNSNSPILSVTTDPTIINSSDKVLVAHVYWESQVSPAISEIHYFVPPANAYGKANKIANRLINTFRYERSSGLSLGEVGTRNITLSSGVVWYGDSSISLSSLDTSGSSKIHFYYHVGGNWVVDNSITQYNNTQYDNGTALQTLSSGRYTVNWIYRSVNHAEFFIVLGAGDYKLLEAQSSLPPTLPTLISRQAILVGRIIVEKSASTATQINSAFDTKFADSSIIPHNDLTGLQGGTTSQYYHLTAAEHSNMSVTVQSLNATGNITGNYVKFYGSTANQTLTLPAGSSSSKISIRNSASVSVSIARSGSDTIEGETSLTLNIGESTTLVFIGTDWTVF